MSNKAGAGVRAAAAETVTAVLGEGQSLDAAIAAHEERVAATDRPLLRMLAYGALRHHWILQAWIDALLEKPLKKKDRVVNALLAIGLFQLWETRIPPHAAVSATVEATRSLRRPKLAGLVNACMRRFQRDQLVAQPPADDEARFNHPRWLIDRLQKDWPDDWQTILEANNARAPMWLRVNTTRSTTEDFRQRLADAGIAATAFEGVPAALRLAEPCPVEQLPGFADGDVSVQDAAAQVAADWLFHGGERRLLDACAAPGGKTGHLLELGGGHIDLVAVDSDADRAAGIRGNLERLGFDATIVTADASNPDTWWDGKRFDGILLDAPCSATGVIRRHPDIKLLRRASDIARLSELQGDLLAALWPLLAPGGHLLYATCSVLPAENEDVVGRFLESQDDAREDAVLPNNNIRDLMRRKVCGYQVLPGSAGLDGFYYARLEKKVS